MKSLVIVESPTKIKTLKKYLPGEYVIDSSMGHIRDLPANAKEVPKKFKGEEWANLGVNTENDFEPIYVIPRGKKKVIKRLKKELKDSDELILATDEDREGEAISWHLTELLKPDVPVKRMVFREITEEAIKEALNHFRDIDMNLVNAQEARRIIDRLAGYTISPLLWKKIAPGLSAGRVQSVAVRFMVERERERMKYRSARYWDLKAQLHKENDEYIFDADLTHLDGKRLASGKDFDEHTGKLKKPKKVVLLDDKSASELRDDLDEAEWKVSEVKKNRKKRNPSPAFITSTLQQEANRKLNFSAKRTMGVAQKLYEMDKSYENVQRLADFAIANGENQKAIDYLKEALEITDDTEAKKDITFEISEIYQNEGDLRAARRYARQAINLDSNWGEPYIRIAQIYANAISQCTSGRQMERGDRTVYWLVLDYLDRARSVDPSTSSYVNRLYRSYEPVMPNGRRTRVRRRPRRR
jgi:DNA topoisomerase IA